jgi:hypothetical protein
MGKRLAPATAERGSACADSESLHVKVHGGNKGEATHRALDHVTWDRHVLPTFAPAAQRTNAPLAGSPSSGAHGANSFGR